MKKYILKGNIKEYDKAVVYGEATIYDKCFILKEKQLDKKLGIKHIRKPKDLPKLSDQSFDTYRDQPYPYDSKYTKLPVKKKKVKKRVLSTKQTKVKPKRVSFLSRLINKYIKK